MYVTVVKIVTKNASELYYCLLYYLLISLYYREWYITTYQKYFNMNIEKKWHFTQLCVFDTWSKLTFIPCIIRFEHLFLDLFQIWNSHQDCHLHKDKYVN